MNSIFIVEQHGDHIYEVDHISELAGSKIQKKEQSNRVLSYSHVENNDKMLEFYTVLQNKKVFEWIMNKIKDKIAKLQYYQGKK